MKLDPSLIPYTKINSKLIKNLTVRAKTIRLLEENIGENLHNIGFNSVFLSMTLKSQATEYDKLNVIKITNFCASQDNNKRVKIQPTKWEKYIL